LHEQQFDRAIADLIEAAKLDPNDSSTFYNRAVAYSAKREHDRAIADYTTAIKLDPDRLAAYTGRAAALSAKRNYDGAIADYTEAIRLDRKIAMHFTTAPQRIAPSRTSTMPLRILPRQ
jgi:tetratricopeptide (TPR) repeat protein